MRVLNSLLFGFLLAAAAPCLHAQATGAAQTVRKSAEAAAQAQTPTTPADKNAAKPGAQNASKSAAPAGNQSKSATPAAGKPAAPAGAAKSGSASTAKPAAAQGAKTGAQAPGKPGPEAVKPAGKAGEKAAAKPAKKAAVKKAARKPAVKPAKREGSSATLVAQAGAEPRIPRRDPFESLVGRESGGGGPKGPLPPGKAGLQVGTLRLDGVVRAPNGMIAVVSNPQLRTYFLREGDQLYDGRVEKIAMDGVSFHEIGKDAFGKPVERQVNKRIYASAGEQQ